MAKELAKLSDVTQTLLFKLRLSKLDKTQRSLQRHGVTTSDGFLTIDGAQVFLDALWQANPDMQKDIADKLNKMNKEEKSSEGKS